MRLIPSVRILLKGLLLLVLLVAVGVGYGVWRLGQGPWSLDPVLPYVEQALSDPAIGQRMTLNHAEVIWDPETKAVGVNIRGLRVYEGERAILAAPRLTLFVDGAKLLTGRLSPTEVLIEGLALRVNRSAEGAYSMAFFSGGSEVAQPAAPVPATSAPDAAAPGAPVPDTSVSDTRVPDATVDDGPRDFILKTLGPKRGAGATSDLTALRLRGASLVIDDARQGVTLRVPQIDLSLRRDGEGLVTGRIAAQVQVAPQTFAPVSTRIRLVFNDADREDDDRLTLEADAGPVRPAQLARLMPDLAVLSGIDAPATLSGSVTMEGLDRITAATLDMRLDAGMLHHALLPGGSVAVTSGQVKARYQSAGASLKLEQARLVLADGIEAELSAEVGTVAPHKLTAAVKLTSVPVDSLPGLWPRSMAPNPRDWITANLTKGKVPLAEATLAASWAGAGHEPVIDHLTAAVEVEGLQVNYFGKLPPAVGVAGRMTYDHATGRMNIATKGGQISGTKVTVGPGQIVISGLDQEDQAIRIELPLKGPAADILSVIDQPPLGFAKKLGVLPAKAGGEAEGRLTMQFPLLAALKIEQVALQVEATTKGGVLPGVATGFDLSDADLKLKIDTKSLSATGTGRVNGVPMSLTVMEPFQARVYRSLTASGTVDDAGRKALRLPGDEYVSGPIGVTLDYQEAAGNVTRLTGTLDLTAARMFLDELVWEKPAGVPATGVYDVTLINYVPRTVTNFEVKGTDTELKLSARFSETGVMQMIDAPVVKLGKTDMAATLTRQRAGWAASLKGPRLDLVAYQARERAALVSTGQQPPPQPLTLTATLGAVQLVPGRDITNLAVRLNRDGHIWRELDASGSVGGKVFRAKITPTADGRQVSGMADDLGALLVAADLTDKIIGGRAQFEGKFLPNTSGVTGQATVSTYRLRDVPVVARILAVASITGIPEMMAGEGLAFDSTEVKFRFDEKTVDISEAYSSGLSIGLTARGLVDRNTAALDLVGEVVPLAGINRVVGAIPILGDLLTGGKGGGIFAWNWVAKGTVSDPDVSVNPVSVLAPGILRRLFQSSPGDAAPRAPAPFAQPDNR